VADAGHLALVEITRALLYAYKNQDALTELRLAKLAPLFDTVLDHFGSADIEELLSYVVHVFGEGSVVRPCVHGGVGRRGVPAARRVIRPAPQRLTAGSQA
jgi:hypothetical protein